VTAKKQIWLWFLFGFLTVVGSESVVCGDLLLAPTTVSQQEVSAKTFPIIHALITNHPFPNASYGYAAPVNKLTGATRVRHFKTK